MVRKTKKEERGEEQEAEFEELELDAETEPAEPVDEFTALRAERDDYLARWQRAQADYQNMRRRELARSEEYLRRALQPLLEKMLVVLDYLDMALATPATNDESRNLAVGVRLTRDQFLQALEQEGVRPLEAAESFDAALHEAKGTVVQQDAPPGTIVETVRTGYTWQGEILRHAHVIVAADADTEPAQEEALEPSKEEADDSGPLE